MSEPSMQDHDVLVGMVLKLEARVKELESENERMAIALMGIITDAGTAIKSEEEQG